MDKSSIFQVTVSGDLEALGEVGKDPYTGRHIVRWKPAVAHPGKIIRLEYVSAIITGFAGDEIDMEGYGEVGYELDGKRFPHSVLFAQSIQDDKAIAQAGQPIQLYVPPSAKPYFIAPLFAGQSGGPSGGGRLSLTGVYV